MEEGKLAITKKEAQVSIEEKLGEVNLSDDSQKPKPIQISTRLTEEEKTNLIELLKEFKDVFAQEYNEIPRANPNLVSNQGLFWKVLCWGGIFTQNRQQTGWDHLMPAKEIGRERPKALPIKGERKVYDRIRMDKDFSWDG